MHGLVLFFDADWEARPLARTACATSPMRPRGRRPSSRKTLEPLRAGRTLRAPCPGMTRSPA